MNDKELNLSFLFHHKHVCGLTHFYKHFGQNIIPNNSVGHGMDSGVKTGHYQTYVHFITSHSVTHIDITNN